MAGHGCFFTAVCDDESPFPDHLKSDVFIGCLCWPLLLIVIAMTGLQYQVVLTLVSCACHLLSTTALFDVVFGSQGPA
jgi:hypothetical protein